MSDRPLNPTLVIPPDCDTDLTECLFDAGDKVPAGDMMTDAFTGERVPLREAWTCPETGWYVYANGAYTKVADADECEDAGTSPLQWALGELIDAARYEPPSPFRTPPPRGKLRR